MKTANKKQFKEDISNILSKQSDSYWDKSEGDYSKLSKEDRKLNESVEKKTVNSLVRLFDKYKTEE